MKAGRPARAPAKVGRMAAAPHNVRIAQRRCRGTLHTNVMWMGSSLTKWIRGPYHVHEVSQAGILK